jgi:hypothetical protein
VTAEMGALQTGGFDIAVIGGLLTEGPGTAQ